MLATGLLLLLGGCGDGGGATTASRTPVATATPAAAKAKGPTGSAAPVLVEMTMQRPGALLDKITIHTDGYGLFDRPSGGVGRVQRDVVVKRSVLERLRASLAKVRGDGGEAKEAPELVFFQRQGAGGATLDTFTVRRDGSGRLEKRYGGAGGRFKDLELRDGVLPRLRAALKRLPRSGSTLTRGSPPPGGAQYLLRYRGRTFTAREGGVVPRARPAVRILDGFIDGVGVRKVTRENATHSP